MQITNPGNESESCVRARAASQSAGSYRPDIDGLRAIAILCVVLYHAHFPWTKGGFTGVDIFFVISGYLIGGHIFSELTSEHFSFAEFYKRRAKRILPAFYLVIAFTILGSILLFSPFEAYKFARWAIASVLAVSNIFFSLGLPYFGSSSEFNPLLMTWSLGVEEQFYAVIPLLMIVLVRKRRTLLLPAMIALCILSFGFACAELTNYPSRAFFLLPSRAWELGIGVILAVIELSSKLSLFSSRWAGVAGCFGFAGMLIPAYLLTSESSFPGYAALPSVLGTALVIAVPDCWINRRLLSLPPLVFIGRVSYSWYLWHWPMLAFLRVTTGGGLPPATSTVVLLLSFAAAVVSYYLVEQPFRRSTTAPKLLLLRYAAIGLVLICTSALLAVNKGFPERYPALIKSETVGVNPCQADYGNDKPNLSRECYQVSPPRPSVVLWGDSHAGVLAMTLRNSANAAGYNFVEFTKSACLPIQGAADFIRGHTDVATECIRFNNSVLKLIAADSSIRTVILAARWEAPFVGDGNPLVTETGEQSDHSLDHKRAEIRAALEKTLLSLQHSGKQVIILDDAPGFDFDPICRFRTSMIPARRTLASLFGIGAEDDGLALRAFISATDASTDMLHSVASEFRNVEVMDLKSNLCDLHNHCKYRIGDRLLYSDSGHLTQDGAQTALQSFQIPHVPQADPALAR